MHKYSKTVVACYDQFPSLVDCTDLSLTALFLSPLGIPPVIAISILMRNMTMI